jgi:ATP-binding cassette, subfamily B, bacterial PglK
MHNFKKLLFLLTPYEQKHAGLLLIMIIIMAFLDMIGIASILPFMAVLTNPTLIETNIILNTMFQVSNIFGVESNKQFLFALGALVFVLLITSLAFKALTTYVQVRFAQMREYSIGKRLVEGYLHQPYSWFLSRNSADLGKAILSEVQQLISNGISPSLELIAKGTVTIAIIILLIIADPKLTLIVGLSLASSYGMIFYILRKYLNQIGKKRLINNQLRFKSVSEAFGAAKEIKVGGLEQIYVNLFSNSAQNYARTQASVRIVAQLPRFILEAIAFGGVLLLILYLMNNSGSFNNALPIVSLYIFAGYRLLPALQTIYSSLTQITFVGPSLDKIYNDIKNIKPFNENQDEDVLDLNKKIILKDIHYNYPNSSKTVLKDINLSIPSKSTVGVIGTTGSGKTTLVDIILGLLDPQKGSLEIDGKIITKQNLRSWQRSIGYVPQHIYLTDDTVEANIAFGESFENIKKDLVEKAAKVASLHEFVVNELPKKYQTIIGERGIRLSGGQRQRIGIARALYHNPKVLILDEATSALDNDTEKAVMESINNLSKKMTIILIAHRLNTVKICDYIIKLDQGQIASVGKYNDIVNKKI